MINKPKNKEDLFKIINDFIDYQINKKRVPSFREWFSMHEEIHYLSNRSYSALKNLFLNYSTKGGGDYHDSWVDFTNKPVNTLDEIDLQFVRNIGIKSAKEIIKLIEDTGYKSKKEDQ